MEYIAGDIKDHDWEMENVEWLPIDEVEKDLHINRIKKFGRRQEKSSKN